MPETPDQTPEEQPLTVPAVAPDPEAEEQPPAADEPEVDLVAMVKERKTLKVHPTCVAAHEALGWRKK